MCGHVGVFGFNGGKNTDLFEDMLTVNQLRGKDSTGICAVNSQGHPRVLKTLGGPNNIFYNSKYRTKVVNRLDIMCLLGHGRQATIGNITESTAHPFHVGNIILAHNGTQHNYIDLIKDAPEGVKFDSDSQAIAWAMANKGVHWTWERITGAAALVWWDIKNKTINFLRNEKRTLFFGRSYNKIIWASEEWMIREMCLRNSVSIEGGFWYFAPNHWWSFSYKPGKLEETREILEPAKVAEETNPFGVNWGDYGGEWNHPIQKSTVLEKVVDRFMQNKNKMTVKDDDPFSRLKAITEGTYRKKYSLCAFCGEDISEEYNTSVLINDYQAACDECANTAEDEGMNLWAL